VRAIYYATGLDIRASPSESGGIDSRKSPVQDSNALEESNLTGGLHPLHVIDSGWQCSMQ
jgi:hypothetical protein